jgi:hypothetical protein
MFGVPLAIPVTIPVPVPTVAIAVLLLLQLPKPVAFARFVVLPTHTVGVPVIATGIGLTVTRTVAIHPVDNLYVIVGVPADTPVTMPDAEPTAARAVLLLLHDPGEETSARVVVALTHTT